MHPFTWIPLLASFAAAAVAGAILSRDPAQRVNRLLAGVLCCSAFWSLCEVVAALSDPDAALWAGRLAGLGWLAMGPLSVHTFIELENREESRTRRLLPPTYALTALLAALFVATPLGLVRAIRLPWGFGYELGPLLYLGYALLSTCVGLVMLQWSRLDRSGAPRAERRVADLVLAAVGLAMLVGSVTDVLLPALDRHVPRLGSTSLLLLGTTVAWSMRRHGSFPLAPSGFTREILDSLQDGVVLLDADDRILLCNRAFVRLTGRAPRSLHGTCVSALLPGPWEGPEAEEFRDSETRLEPARGEPFPVSVSASRLHDAGGGRAGRVLAVRDLREVAALRGRLVTSGRLAAVGELAAGIAHEISNPIGFVRTNLNELRLQWAELGHALAKHGEPGSSPGTQEGDELIEEALEGIDRVAAIVRDVRAFSHAGLGRPQLVCVNELIENAANVAALHYKATVERCYGDVPRVPGAPHLLRQVFLNLLFNASQAVADGGRVRIVTERDGEQVVVRIQDDGCGIPSDVIDRVFDPFFTTRPAGEGTGLGLSLCYQIVRSHRGDLEVESEPGVGSSFRVLLPIEAPAAD